MKIGFFGYIEKPIATETFVARHLAIPSEAEGRPL